ncbi:MAG TPA: glycosyltransferase family protein [Acidimicrobiia bacterium]
MIKRRGRTLAIVQARTSSSRLPGKVLKPLEGEPMILRQLERISRAGSLDQIVVATSDHPSDDELAQFLQAQGFDVVRGPLDDVLHRFALALDTHPADVVVRLTADCPLISPAVIDQLVEAFHAGNADYLSNTMEPTYPDGLDVEVVTADALRYVDEQTADKHEREHVTLGVYRRPDQFVITNFRDPSGADHSDLRWTVDTPEDFAFVEAVYRDSYPHTPDFEYADVLSWVDANPELVRTSADSARNAALDGLDTGAMQHQAGRAKR